MHRTRIAVAAAAGLAILVTVVPGAASGQGTGAPAPATALDAAERRALEAGVQVAPKAPPGRAPAGPNPYLAWGVDPATADYAGWRRELEARAAARAAERPRAAVDPVLVDEDEPAGIRGSNDTPATAEVVDGFGTAQDRNPRARVLGELSPEVVPVQAVDPTPEDDGAIPLAGDLVTAERPGATVAATVGDGPHGSTGSGSGDFDVYRVLVAAGDQVVADIDAAELDSVLSLYDEQGDLLATNDDGVPGDLTSLLSFRVPAAGTYYVLVAGFGSSPVPGDPFDSASGFGVGSEGDYQLTVTAGAADVDTFAVDLAAGDVLGASVAGGAGRVTVRDPAGLEVFGSGQDFTGIYPAESPLPGGGNAVADHVASTAGRYTVDVTAGAGPYDLTIEAYRPGPETAEQGTVQTLFLDFDGERINTAIFGGPGVRTLSPLSAFLGRWGLTPDDEGALVDAISATVDENIRRDLESQGNPQFAVDVRTSADGPDPFGQPNVSRVVVGGTIEESGVPTVGIAQSIDPGNFGREESALLLLDVLSEPAGPDTPVSVNSYLGPESDRIAFLGQAIGNVAAHEAGHFYGNWHTDQLNGLTHLMDAGGANIGNFFGVGPDMIGGTEDDVDVDFDADVLNPGEGFTGTEDTVGRTAQVLTRGGGNRPV